MTATFVVAVLTIESMNLPIFRDMYHLNILLLKDVENIPKMYRHTLGDRIVTTAMNAYQQLQKAYDAQVGLRKLYAMEGFATGLNKQDCSADEAMASINSYLGLLRHHATFNIRRRLLGKLDPRWLKKLNNNKYEKVTIKSSNDTEKR